MAIIDGVETGHSRRDLLKRAAVVGAVAWTAPMVFSSPAFAASSKCVGSNRCTKFYGVTISSSDVSGTVSAPAGNNGGCGAKLASAFFCDGVTYPVGTVLQTGSITYTAPAADTNGTVVGSSFTVTLPAGAIPLAFDLHLGGSLQNCTFFNWNASTSSFEAAPNACGLVITTVSTNPYTFKVFLATTRPSGCGGFSGSNVYYCS